MAATPGKPFGGSFIVQHFFSLFQSERGTAVDCLENGDVNKEPDKDNEMMIKHLYLNM